MEEANQVLAVVGADPGSEADRHLVFTPQAVRSYLILLQRTASLLRM